MKKVARIHRYEQIAQALRGDLESSVFAPGTKLPSERQLMARFEVQRNTIRQAIALLEAEGKVVTEVKRGTFVAGDQGESTSGTALSGQILLINPWNRSSTAMTQVAVGLHRALEGTDLSVIRYNSAPIKGLAPHRMPDVGYLRSSDTRGVILWPHSGAGADDIRYLTDEVPLVLIDRRVPGLTADIVRTADIDGAAMMTRHLFDIGHRHVAFLADDPFAETVHQRWQGFAFAHEERGLTAEGSNFIGFYGMSNPPFDAVVRSFLENREHRLTALVCSNDGLASVLIACLRRLGLRVPDDIAVTGYGDLLPDMTAALDLTSVRQPFEEVGFRAGKRLLLRAQERKQNLKSGPFDEQLPVQLVIRRSSQR